VEYKQLEYKYFGTLMFMLRYIFQKPQKGGKENEFFGGECPKG